MLSSKYNTNIAQVVLRCLIQKEVVVIPKSANMKRINENFNALDLELSADDLTAIKSLDKGIGLIYSV
ncbi:aldo/keto reductase [Pedobacter panaciterrae]|uniref:Aldo/keto reductase n=1 Tax=Pedobacter panaciterrae TaxID=363849 RepID=A0ABU8NHG1_9SPHI|nr:aldo/keto reductase [uncultured Pedobacter sp.]